MVKLKKQMGFNYINEPTMKRLSLAINNYRTKKSNGVALLNAFDKFLEWFINYVNAELAGKIITQIDAANQLFVNEIISSTQLKKYLFYSLYAAREYAQDLRRTMEKSNARNYYEIALDVLSDYEPLLCAYETNCNNVTPSIIPHWGKSTVLPMQEMIWGAKQIMYAETTPSMADFNYHDVRPIVSFQIRQIVEIMGKNIIGYSRIKKHSNGREAFNMTQESWKFLKDLEDNGTLTNFISMPLPPSVIRKINEWSNHFVHRAYIDTCYTRYFALLCIFTIMTPPANPILGYNGLQPISTSFGNIQIQHYNTLKSTFEQRLNPRKQVYDVEWLPIQQVGAYIISL